MSKKTLIIFLFLFSVCFLAFGKFAFPAYAFEEVNTPSPYVKRIVPIETQILPGGVELRSQGVRTQKTAILKELGLTATFIRLWRQEPITPSELFRGA